MSQIPPYGQMGQQPQQQQPQQPPGPQMQQQPPPPQMQPPLQQIQQMRPPLQQLSPQIQQQQQYQQRIQQPHPPLQQLSPRMTQQIPPQMQNQMMQQQQQQQQGAPGMISNQNLPNPNIPNPSLSKSQSVNQLANFSSQQQQLMYLAQQQQQQRQQNQVMAQNHQMPQGANYPPNYNQMMGQQARQQPQQMTQQQKQQIPQQPMQQAIPQQQQQPQLLQQQQQQHEQQPQGKPKPKKAEVAVVPFPLAKYLQEQRFINIDVLRKVMLNKALEKKINQNISDDVLRAIIQGLKLYLQNFLERAVVYSYRRQNTIEIGSKHVTTRPINKLALLSLENRFLNENIPITTQSMLPSDVIQAIASRKLANEREEILNKITQTEEEPKLPEENEEHVTPKGTIQKSDIVFVFENLKSSSPNDIFRMQLSLAYHKGDQRQ